MKRQAVSLAVVVLAIAACSVGGSIAPPPGPTPTPLPTPGPARTLAELKYALIERFGALWYCDPDFYPIQRQDEIDAARERWAEVIADTEAFAAIAARQALDLAGDFTDDEKLAVYRAWKVLNAIALDPIGNGTYRFDYLAEPAVGGGGGNRTAGTINADGDMTIEQQAPAQEPMCPICLTLGTGIDTPDGRMAVQDLRIGDPVWTLDARGRRSVATIIAVGSTAAPANHAVLRLVLADGRTLAASPGHPLADGRGLGEARAGDLVDGSIVVSADLERYAGSRTYDILVSGPTGIYLADGIPMASTLHP